jgi:hypothetical protein
LLGVTKNSARPFDLGVRLIETDALVELIVTRLAKLSCTLKRKRYLLLNNLQRSKPIVQSFGLPFTNSPLQLTVADVP